MPQAIDPVWLGERLGAERGKRRLTLQQVCAETGVSVPTLSRIERGAAKGLNSDTLLTLADWIGVDVKLLRMTAESTVHPRGTVQSTPDVVALHLRADKNLDAKSAKALASLFKTIYDQFSQHAKKG